MRRSWASIVLVILVACQPVTAMPAPTTPDLPELTATAAPETPVHYELRQPTPDDLLEMIDSVLLMEEQMAHNDDVASAILQREPDSLQHLISKDFERYYPNGFPGAEDLITGETLPWEMKSFADLSSFSVVLRIALLQYINNHQDVLQDGKPFQLPNTNLRVFSMDLDGNGNVEWLVGAEYYEYFLQNWLLVNKQDDGFYHLLPGFAYDLAGVQDYTTDIEIHDLTGDGNSEIIKIQHFYMAGRTHGSTKVFTWDKNQLSSLRSILLPNSAPIYGASSEYVVDDFNGDGLVEIRVDSPQFKRFGCEWTMSTTYYLDRRSPDVEVTDEEIPLTNDCLIARALESKDPREQIRLYQKALESFDLSKLSTDKLAWLKLQLAMAFAANGEDEEASSQVENLVNLEGNGKFLEFIKDKYAVTGSPSALDFCDTLYTSIAAQRFPERFDSEIDIDLTNYGYPIQIFPLPELVCPFPEVIRARLHHLDIPVTESPVDVLAAQGYPFAWTQLLSNNAAPVWLGALQFGQPILVVMVGEKNWRTETIEVDALGLSNAEAVVHQTADGAEAKIFALLTTRGKYCDPPDAEKQLISIDPNTLEYEKELVCDSVQYSLKNERDIQHTLEEFSKPYYFEAKDSPGWYYLPGISEFTSQQKTVLEPVNELEDKVLSQSNAGKTASEISALVETLPKEDPTARILLNRLYYLRGLNYELSGQKELAVEAYLDLIAFSPESLWSQYAGTRIQPVQP